MRLPQHVYRSRLPDSDVHAVLLPPINFIFKLLQQRATVSIWLYENLGMRIEGKLRVGRGAPLKAIHGADSTQGFDEFMNLVIDDAVEVTLAKKESPEERRKLGECIWLSGMRQRIADFVQARSSSKETTFLLSSKSTTELAAHELHSTSAMTRRSFQG